MNASGFIIPNSLHELYLLPLTIQPHAASNQGMNVLACEGASAVARFGRKDG